MIDIKDRSFEYSVRSVKWISSLCLDRKYYSIVDQVLRSSTSIGANVQEGRGASSSKELIRYYSIALRSANETKYWLKLINKGLEIENEEMNFLIKEVEEISRIIGKSIITLKAKNELKLKMSKTIVEA